MQIIFLKNRAVHIIATDAHSTNSRPPKIQKALQEAEKILGHPRKVKEMTIDTPKCVISDQPVFIQTSIHKDIAQESKKNSPPTQKILTIRIK